MTLQQFVESAEVRRLRLVTINREAPEPVQRLLSELFEEQSVEVDEEALPEESGDAVYLIDDGEVVAASPLSALQDSILLVNSDLYITGTRAPEDVELPDVLAALSGTRFTLRGYPQSDREKLLLITVSRYIERLALEENSGQHRASFQRLSRINDERGTRRVYDRLGGSDVETHVYGVPDWTPPSDLGVTMHGGRTSEYQNSWFVVFVPESADASHAALVALQIDRGIWDAYWTFEPDEVRDIAAYIRREL